jgi:hypothetical protein
MHQTRSITAQFERTKRETKVPEHLGMATSFLAATTMDYVKEPDGYSEAIRSDDALDWLEAMAVEMESLHENKTWDLVEPPHGCKVIKSKWVYKMKESMDGLYPVKYKACLVAKGFSQKEGIDYTETYSPVVSFPAIRCLFSLIATMGLKAVHMDVTTAFLYGQLDEEIYMAQPEGFEDTKSPTHVCRLKKSLYGLKQSPRQWNKEINDCFVQYGLEWCKIEPCIYYKRDGASIMFVAIYVDDLILAGNTPEDMEDLKNSLNSQYKMKDLGEPRLFLGMEIKRDLVNKTLSLSQDAYVQNILKWFNMDEAKTASSPMDSSVVLSQAQCPSSEVDKQEMEHVPYRNLIGSCMYLLNCTRPDIAFAVGKLSWYLANPGKAHWHAGKHLLRYLKGSTSVSLVLGANVHEDPKIHGYGDADWAGDPDTRKSTTGLVVFLWNWSNSLEVKEAIFGGSFHHRG